MPTVRPTNAFQRWVAQHLQPVERASVSSLLQDLDDYMLVRTDPDLFILDKHVAIGSAQVPGLAVDFFVLPARISTGVFRSRVLWFGLCEIQAGHHLLVGRVLALTGWMVDQRARLVSAQDELKALVAAEFP